MPDEKSINWAEARNHAAEIEKFLSRLSAAQKIFEAVIQAEKNLVMLTAEIERLTKQREAAHKALTEEEITLAEAKEKAIEDRRELNAGLDAAKREISAEKQTLADDRDAFAVRVASEKDRLEMDLKAAAKAYDAKLEKMRAREEVVRSEIAVLEATRDHIRNVLQPAITQQEE